MFPVIIFGTLFFGIVIERTEGDVVISVPNVATVLKSEHEFINVL